MAKARIQTFIIALLFVPFCATAQISEPESLTEVRKRYAEYMASKDQITVYRITVLLTRDRRKMESERSRFYGRLPNYKLEWTYEQPYYVLKTGLYLTERESWHDLEAVKAVYPNAILSNERISPSEFID